MKKLIAVLALIPTLAFADEPSKWTTFTKMPDGLVWEYKNGSLDLIKGNGEPYWIVQWRTHKDGNASYDFVKIAVSWHDCKKEAGQIMVIDMTNEVKSKIDFVFDGETLGSNIAKAICVNGNNVLQKMPKQTEESSEEPKPTST